MQVVTQNSEGRLLATLNSIKTEYFLYYGIHLHLSKLLSHNGSRYQVKIALNIAENFFKQQEGMIFLCSNNDLIILYKGEDRTLVEKSIFQLRYLFMDDPLAFDQEGTENRAFCSVYLLSFQWLDFVGNCEKIVKPDSRAPEKFSNLTDQPKHLTPALLLDLEHSLKTKVDISHLIRRQQVWALSQKNHRFEPIYQRFSLTVSHLNMLLGRDINFYMETSLLEYLERQLEEQLIDFLPIHLELNSCEIPLGINLKVRTILTPQFNKFLELYRRKYNLSIMLEITLAELFKDLSIYQLAREYLHNFGSYICLSGLSVEELSYINIANLKPDLVKIRYTDNVLMPYQNLLDQLGSNRVILEDCDTEFALDFGIRNGFSLFQGYYLERLLIKNKLESNQPVSVKSE